MFAVACQSTRDTKPKRALMLYVECCLLIRGAIHRSAIVKYANNYQLDLSAMHTCKL
jgi:hypothetical protein